MSEIDKKIIAADAAIKAARDAGLIVIAYDRLDVETVSGKKVTDEQYRSIVERVESDDLLWDTMMGAVIEAVRGETE